MGLASSRREASAPQHMDFSGKQRCWSILTVWWLAGRGHVFNDPALKSQQSILSHLLCHITWEGTA